MSPIEPVDEAPIAPYRCEAPVIPDPATFYDHWSHKHQGNCLLARILSRGLQNISRLRLVVRTAARRS